MEKGKGNKRNNFVRVFGIQKTNIMWNNFSKINRKHKWYMGYNQIAKAAKTTKAALNALNLNFLKVL